MSGLDKIIARISDESSQKIQTIIKEAEEQAAQIASDNESRIEEECGRIARKADSSARNTADRAEASAKLRTKQILLAGRQELLADTINKAKQSINKLPDSEYGEFILKLFRNHLPDSSARLILSKSSMQKLGDSLILQLRELAAQNGSELTVAESDTDIGDGFILDFGGTEENCTVGALIERSMDELSDRAKDVLF